jgi:hypothetical protein
MTKVDEKAQTHSGCFKVIDELRLVLGKQARARPASATPKVLKAATR